MSDKCQNLAHIDDVDTTAEIATFDFKNTLQGINKSRAKISKMKTIIKALRTPLYGSESLKPPSHLIKQKTEAIQSPKNTRDRIQKARTEIVEEKKIVTGFSQMLNSLKTTRLNFRRCSNAIYSSQSGDRIDRMTDFISRYLHLRIQYRQGGCLVSYFPNLPDDTYLYMFEWDTRLRARHDRWEATDKLQQCKQADSHGKAKRQIMSRRGQG